MLLLTHIKFDGETPMEFVSNIVLIAHIVAGFSALSMFWVQVLARKGGLSHKRYGTIYIKFMWAVVASALLLCVGNLLSGNTTSALFLGFISLITAKPLWLGVAVLDARKGPAKNYRNVSMIFDVSVVVSGVGLMSYGLFLGGSGERLLLIIFGGLGMSHVFDLVGSIRSRHSDSIVDWMKTHIVSMGGSGIAAHTAFLVFGVNRII